MPQVCQYDWLVWIDGSIHIKHTDFIKDFLNCAKNGFALLKHPNRDDVMREISHSYNIPKYKHINFDDIRDFLLKEGFPNDYGLWCAGIQIKRNDPEINLLNDQMWKHVLKCGEQDQIILPYVFWKYLGRKPDTFDPEGGLYHSDYLSKVTHKDSLERLGKK